MPFVTREIEPVLREYLKAFPVVGLTGPRQSGKSTLLRHALPEYTYVTFDDIRHRNYFLEDPVGFIQTYHNHVIFDEVQQVPELFSAIKLAVDEDRHNYGKFILTGSAQFSMVEKITESLAGRIGLLSLLPFQYSELPSPQTKAAAIYNGSYPELVMRDYMASAAWYSAYLDTYLNRDVRQLSNIGDLRDFERFIHLLAARTSQLLNLSDFANNLGISVPTVKRWLSILEASYVVFTLPPFYDNLGKRIIKSPKVYFHDTGLLSYLVGIQSREMYENGPMAGAIFENYVLAEIHKKLIHKGADANLYFYRTEHGAEVDLIVDFKSHKHFVEIKKTASFAPKLLKGMNPFAETLSEHEKAFLLYNGPTQAYHLPVEIIPWQEYLAREIP